MHSWKTAFNMDRIFSDTRCFLKKTWWTAPLPNLRSTQRLPSSHSSTWSQLFQRLVGERQQHKRSECFLLHSMKNDGRGMIDIFSCINKWLPSPGEITRNNVVPLAEIQPLMNHNAVFLTTFITKTGSTNIMKKLFFKMIRIHNTFFFPNEQQFHIRFKSIRCCKNNTCCTRTMRKNIKFYGRAVPNFNSVTQIKYFFALYYACSSAHSQFLKIIQE